MRLSYKQFGFKQALLPLALFAGLCYSSTSSAGIWVQPTLAKDVFNSRGIKVFNILPSGPEGTFTGVGNDLVGRPTTVVRDEYNPINPTNTNVPESIYTEITDFLLVGSVNLFPGKQAEIQAGFGNTFFSSGVGLDHTRGEIQDLASNTNTMIDFPAPSIFDVFFDIWIDMNNDNVAENGEVFSNDIRDSSNNFLPSSSALRMSAVLPSVPPPDGTIYLAIGGIPHLDPHIGTFQTVPTTWPYLYEIDKDRHCLNTDTGGNCVAFAQVAEGTKHIVPEPSTFYLLAVAFGLFGYSRRKTVFRSNQIAA